MSLRIDTTELISGAYVVGDTGLGVVGADVPASGEHGPSFLYNDLALPADAGKEVRGLIVTPPSSGSLFAHEDGSFEFTGSSAGAYSFTYRLFVDGADMGTASASFTVGAGGITASVSGSGLVAYSGTAAVVASIGSGSSVTAAVAAAGSVSYTGAAAVAASMIDTPTNTEPVTVAESKQAARISDTSEFDEMIPGLITAARQMAEQETGRELVRKTRRSTFVDWPAADLVLPVYAAESVAISYWGESGWTALDSGAFAFYELGTGTGIAPAIGSSWPALSPVAGGPRVRVDVTAGPADPATADACIKQYIKALVSWWIDNPGAAAQGNMQPAPYLRNLLDPVRLWA